MARAVDALAQIEWDPERFGIGIRQIDDQHKHLIQLINRLTSLVQTEYEAGRLQQAARSQINTTSSSLEVQQQQQQQAQPSSPQQPTPRHDTFTEPSTGHTTSLPPLTGGRKANSAAKLFMAATAAMAMGGMRVRTPSMTASIAAYPPAPIVNPHIVALGPAPVDNPAAGLRSFNPNYQKGSAVCECLASLVTYCLKHLAAEDNILETYGYADRATQLQEHEAFGEQLCRYYRLCEDYSLEEEDLLHLLVFLKLWVKEHIPRDRRYAPLLLEKGIGV